VNEIEVPVLIAGGSLVGLTTSVLLGSKGVKSLVVERHPGTAIHPRAAMLHQRTIEIFREAGLSDVVSDAAGLEFVQNGAIMAVEALGGKELVYFQKNVNEGVDHLSPEPRLFITQIGLEPILRDEAERIGAENRFSTELVSFEQDDTGVRSIIRNRVTGEEELVRSEYLVLPASPVTH
jgi:2-polyprenyl-6-methoxyphenol hydroxylase-like FAD-dependent oxidoreductase